MKIEENEAYELDGNTLGSPDAYWFPTHTLKDTLSALASFPSFCAYLFWKLVVKRNSAIIFEQ